MGQSQSQPPRATTPEPDIDPAERARIQAEDRARRAAAVEQRLAAQKPRRKPNGMKLQPSTAEDQAPAPTTTSTSAPEATPTPTPSDISSTTAKLSTLSVSENENENESEDRARRAAAMEKRLAAQQKRGNAGPGSGAGAAGAGKKKLSALEQLSRENKGWRDADEIADLRAWN